MNKLIILPQGESDPDGHLSVTGKVRTTLKTAKLLVDMPNAKVLVLCPRTSAATETAQIIDSALDVQVMYCEYIESQKTSDFNKVFSVIRSSSNDYYALIVIGSAEFVTSFTPFYVKKEFGRSLLLADEVLGRGVTLDLLAQKITHTK